MTPIAFDQTLIAAAFDRAARHGWDRLHIQAAARQAGLDDALARRRFPNRIMLLLRFGDMLDRSALADASVEPDLRARLFDLLMRRFDAMEPHRAGIVALLRILPFQPGTALMLAAATRRSMGRMLDAAGPPIAGTTGQARASRLAAVWLYAARAWAADRSADLAGTMAALDRALDRAGL